MPQGPAFKAPALPEALDPQQASVFDPLYKQLLRRAVSAMGLDDPTTAATSLAPTPLVSIYKNLDGIPKASIRRGTGGKMFQEAVDAIDSPVLREALDHFAKRYPRVAAHMNPQRVAKDLRVPTANAVADIPLGQVHKPVPVRFTDPGIKDIARYGMHDPERGLSRAKNLVHHEGTHVAQALGNKDTRMLYSQANRLFGQYDNPFEDSAYGIGEAIYQGLPRPTTPVNAITNMGKQLKDLKLTKEIGFKPELLKERQGIKKSASEILKERASWGWSPSPDFVPAEVPDWWSKK